MSPSTVIDNKLHRGPSGRCFACGARGRLLVLTALRSVRLSQQPDERDPSHQPKNRQSHVCIQTATPEPNTNQAGRKSPEGQDCGNGWRTEAAS